uniref:Uncharacterized protein n=1 Tax=Chrysotila carterae TaxID=13221 RepID=A0A7S4EYI3_CHRCT
MKLLLLVSALAALVAPAAAWSPATGLPMRTRAVAVTPSMLARDGSTDLSIDEPWATYSQATVVATKAALECARASARISTHLLTHCRFRGKAVNILVLHDSRPGFCFGWASRYRICPDPNVDWSGFPMNVSSKSARTCHEYI